jgi:hypothetical protein
LRLSLRTLAVSATFDWLTWRSPRWTLCNVIERPWRTPPVRAAIRRRRILTLSFPTIASRDDSRLRYSSTIPLACASGRRDARRTLERRVKE